MCAAADMTKPTRGPSAIGVCPVLLRQAAWAAGSLMQLETNVRCWPIVLQKSFLAGDGNFLEPLMRFARGDVRGPHWFTQKRPRTSVSELQGVAASEASKNRLSRDFRRRSISDFCNTIGTKLTWQRAFAAGQRAVYIGSKPYQAWLSFRGKDGMPGFVDRAIINGKVQEIVWMTSFYPPRH